MITMPDLHVPVAVGGVLAAIAYLLVKHWVADFLLQTEYQRKTKGIYGALGGLTHVLTHVLFSAPVFLILSGVSLGRAALILSAEALFHYHLDWSKDNIVRARGWTTRDTYFWWALGMDQLLHGLTYVAMVWAAIAA